MKLIIVVLLLLAFLFAPQISSFVFLRFFPPLLVATRIKKRYAIFRATEIKKRNSYPSYKLEQLFRDIIVIQLRLYSRIEIGQLTQTRMDEYQDYIDDLKRIWNDIHHTLQKRNFFKKKNDEFDL